MKFLKRFFTIEGINPLEEIEWEVRDAVIPNLIDGHSNAFEHKGVEFPVSWSQNATNIAAQKYFRGSPETPEHETSVRQLITRVVNTIGAWGHEGGYFNSEEEAEIFTDELTYLLVTQRAAFNSPVWINVGVPDTSQQCSACFILHVEDEMSSILNWYVEEGTIFKGGSGSGVNLSAIRSSKEPMTAGGTASGPVSFMRGADASAGTIKSGGKTRRAAKMVILNVDHPDVQEFIWCKAVEERKARVLKDAGFDMSLDGKDSFSVQYQNANNSVRATDEFMQAYLDDQSWDLRAVKTGKPIDTVKARDLMAEIAKAAWECADPGMQYDTTINNWHTCPASGKISASNPCSEYMHLDNSACNLASLNLLKFLNEDDSFDVTAFKQAVKIVFLAQEILIGISDPKNVGKKLCGSDYPTEKIGENARTFRQLGLGYANLGALLMAMGLPYDSEEGRAWAGAITAIMTGHAYTTSALIAAEIGAFGSYDLNKQAMLRVMKKHCDAAREINRELIPRELAVAACEVWNEAIELGEQYGYRNSQATVLAPTGTIGLLMDCDTTGIEPDLALVKNKILVGGGRMRIVNQTIPRALKHLDYHDEQIEEITAYIAEHNSVSGAPHVVEDHYAIFDTSMGAQAIHYMGHVKMMAAVQPFISGAISKTVNMPEGVTVEEVEQLFVEGWKLGLKAIAIYRNNCKVAQPLSAEKGVIKTEEKMIQEINRHPGRIKPPKVRTGTTRSFSIHSPSGENLDIYQTFNCYEDGRPMEIFIKAAKQGSTIAGLLDAIAISISIGLQYGVPIEAFIAKYINMRFEPTGRVPDDEDMFAVASVMDYLARRWAIDFMKPEDRHNLGIYTLEERKETAKQHQVDSGSSLANGHVVDAPYCYSCGSKMQPAGSCYVCTSCGTTSGCS